MSDKIVYLKQIDSLRALAILMTLCIHWVPDSGITTRIPYMHLGVDLFFTISGFLITSILLKTKVSYPKPNKFIVIKNFIIRRSLRLFPIYYLFLLSFVLLSATTGFWLWKKGYGINYFTYTSNILFYLKGLQSKLFNHTWSLGVEEQFYLLWPWLVVFLPLNIFKKVILVFISIGIFSYLYYYIIHTEIIPVDQTSKIRMLPFSNFHTLGAGALLAYLWLYCKSNKLFDHFINFAKVYLLISIIIFVFLYENNVLFSLPIALIYSMRETFLSVVLFFLLLSTIIGWKGLIGVAVDNSCVQYIGRISYGIYLYHKPVPFLLSLFILKLGLNVHNSFVLILSYIIITVLIATLSYKYIEKPFLNLKRKFDS